MTRPCAVLLTVAIVCGVPVGITLVTGLVVSADTTGLVGVFVGCAFGTFALDIYRAILDSQLRISARKLLRVLERSRGR